MTVSGLGTEYLCGVYHINIFCLFNLSSIREVVIGLQNKWISRKTISLHIQFKHDNGRENKNVNIHVGQEMK